MDEAKISQIDADVTCDHFEESGNIASKCAPDNAEMYQEALERYPNDASIDAVDEKRVRHKIDRVILPALGICYFFYVSPQKFCCCRLLTSHFH